MPLYAGVWPGKTVGSELSHDIHAMAINWIYDRRPTEKDADKDGLITMMLYPGEDIHVCVHWSFCSGPWCHSEFYVAPTPEPTPAAPEPQAAAPEIPEPIRTGAAPFYVVVISNNCPSTGGEPIVLQHPIPRQTTLQAALQRRDSIGHRYGTTHIAECKIIPELTCEAPANEP